jgi:hypothetical protein
MRSLVLCLVGSVVAWLVSSPLEGWVRPVALVALAGTGALLALRGLRAAAAVVVTVAGLALAAGGVIAFGQWRALVVLAAGLAVVAGGSLALITGRSWPSMSTRYDRTGTARQESSTTDGQEPTGSLARRSARAAARCLSASTASQALPCAVLRFSSETSAFSSRDSTRALSTMSARGTAVISALGVETGRSVVPVDMVASFGLD